ncbi:hypothetical protein EV421DRAFT_1738012 [Armillaria borealis]|uniref:Uncharacterized protein n=1 Tax=Armillaria borealis TaxID=47425 RepID=A0AA39JBU7_9AGAR|nr:hypothetical protein EV421DRAFT_1738012 [Armillaria borealis]
MNHPAQFHIRITLDMPRWQPCIWVPGHYTSPHDYVDLLQSDNINGGSTRDLKGPVNSAGFLYDDLYHPSNPDSHLLSADCIVDPDTAVCYTDGMGDLAVKCTSPAESFPTGPEVLTERNNPCYHPYASHIPLMKVNVVPAVASQSDSMMMTTSACNVLLPQASLSSIMTAENTIHYIVDSLNGIMREELIHPQSRPPSYQKRSFPSEMAERIIRTLAFLLIMSTITGEMETVTTISVH